MKTTSKDLLWVTGMVLSLMVGSLAILAILTLAQRFAAAGTLLP